MPDTHRPTDFADALATAPRAPRQADWRRAPQRSRLGFTQSGPEPIIWHILFTLNDTKSERWYGLWAAQRCVVAGRSIGAGPHPAVMMPNNSKKRLPLNLNVKDDTLLIRTSRQLAEGFLSRCAFTSDRTTAVPLNCKWSNYVAQSGRALWRNRGSGSVRAAALQARELRQQEGNRSTTPDNSIKLRQIVRPKCAKYCDK